MVRLQSSARMDFYFNQVLQAFSRMDAKLLGELLDPDLIYFEVTLPVFEKKIEELFGFFRKDGDEFLEVESGNCCGMYCNPELIRTAYRFVGNHSRNYIDLRFITEPTDDGKDHLIKDIVSCGMLKCHQPKDWYGWQYDIYVQDDEKPGFYLSPDEIIHTELALRAEEEITQGELFDVNEVKVWIQKYQSTLDFIRLNKAIHSNRNMRWNSFFHLVEGLEEFISFLDKWEKTLLVEAWRARVDLPEEVWIEVVLDAEKILMDEGFDCFYYLLTEKNHYRYPYWEKFLAGGNADVFSESWAWYKPRQEKLVQKYYALTEWEAEEFLQSYAVVDPEGRNMTFTFHWEIRQKALSSGEEIPFGLWEENQ